MSIPKIRVRRHGLTVTVIAFLLGLSGILREAGGEYYRYRDENGRVFYVDDIGKVPDAYQGTIQTYTERNDHLSEPERQRLREEQAAREAENLERERLYLEKLSEEEARLTEELSRRDQGGRETPVEFFGNQVLVPVTIRNGGKTVTVPLLLDTGASIIALHRPVADRLALSHFRKAKAKVASGEIIDTQIATLEEVRVGPYKKIGLTAGIIDLAAEEKIHHGLLGMNFLAGLDYRIDYERRVIVWR